MPAQMAGLVQPHPDGSELAILNLIPERGFGGSRQPMSH